MSEHSEPFVQFQSLDPAFLYESLNIFTQMILQIAHFVVQTFAQLEIYYGGQQFKLDGWNFLIIMLVGYF